MKRNFILFCLLIMMAAGSFSSAKAQVNTSDSLALVDFYNSTGGPTWYLNTNWLTTKPVSTWYGVKVTGSRVTSLILSNNRLSGTIPSSIGNLVMLTTLNLDRNSTGGSIPSSIGNLVNLNTLILVVNNLSSTIPSSIGNLTNLKDLELYGNQLSGTIPVEVGNLVKLQILNLHKNNLSGAIPVEVGNLVNLQLLHLYRNNLSGTIPVEVGNLAKLSDLNIAHNNLSGAIPDTLGHLKKLESLYLNSNQLSGTIPYSLSKLRNCTVDLSFNQLSQFGDVYSSKDTNYTFSFIDHNLLTFTGLQVTAEYYPNTTYAPQDTILPIHQNGNVLSVSAGGTLSKNTYRWFKVGDAGKTIIKQDSTFMPAQSGRYYVTVINKIATKLVLRSDTISYTMPLAQAKSSMANVAAVKIVNTHFSIYPNPTSNVVHIQTNGTAIITLTNSAGKVLLSKNINNAGEINISAFANGTYYIQNKTTGEVQKVVVLH